MHKTGISADHPDWSREQIERFWEPGKKMLRAVRRYQAARKRGGVFGKISAKYWVLNHLFWSTICQSEVHLSVSVCKEMTR